MSQVKTYRLADLLTATFPEEDCLIEEGLLPLSGIMVIGGPPKAYKSFILNTVVTNLAIGGSVFWATHSNHGRTEEIFSVTRPCRVLLFEQEIGEADLRTRLASIVDSLDPHQQSLMRQNVFTHSCDHSIQFDTEQGLGTMDRIISEIEPDVVCLDPLIEFHTSDENSTKEMSQVLRHLDYLREKHGFATIINHHTGKPSQDKYREGPDALRGNSVIFAKGDSYLMLNPINRNAGLVRVEFTIRRGKPIKAVDLKLDWATLRANFLCFYTKKNEEKAKGDTDS